MFWEIILAIIFGVISGCITGLIPGIHINLISLLLLSISPFLLQYTSPIPLAIFIIAMSITHSFLDAIPSIYLGAPDPDQALNALPGHKLLLEGKGFEAVKLTVIGSLLALIGSIILIPLFIPFLKYIYPYIKPYIGYILILITLFMIFKDNSRLKNAFIFFLSGILGFITLNIPNLANPLFPLLSGLFGTSMLIHSLSQKVSIPKQFITNDIKLSKSEITKSILGGSIAGSLTGIFPGLGPSQAAVICTQFIKLSQHGFMILVGGLNTVNFAFSLITLLILSKARNGAVIVISKLIPLPTDYTTLVFIISTIITGAIATILALNLSKVFSKLITKISYPKLVITIITLIIFLTIILSGPIGFLILITATFVGLIPALTNTARNHQMGCLLLPVILFFIL